MLTTARKIEIATAVMAHPLLGLKSYNHEGYHNGYYFGICEVLLMVTAYDRSIRDDMGLFNVSLGGTCTPYTYWFETESENHKKARIEFLKKYIEHLKKQENE